MALRFQVPAAPSPLQAATKHILGLLGASASEGARFVVEKDGTAYFGIKPMLWALAATREDQLLGTTPSEKASVAQWVTTALQASLSVVSPIDIEPMLPGFGKFLASSGTPTAADLLLYSVVAPTVTLSPKQYPNLAAWVTALEKTPVVEAIRFARPSLPAPVAGEDSAGRDDAVRAKATRPSDDEIASRKAEKEAARLAKEAQKAAAAASGPSGPPEARVPEEGEEKDAKKTAKKAVNPSELDLRIGVIVAAEKHPDSDKLLVEKIDVGDSEGPRTIVSGIAAYYAPEALVGSTCLVLCNLKPRAIAGISSSGMVLCASTEQQLALVTAVGAAPGSSVFVGGTGIARPTAPSSKQMEELLKHFKTNAEGVVCWQEIPLRIGGGDLIHSAHRNATVK